MSRQKGDIMRVIKHGKAYKIEEKKKRYYVNCPECKSKVYCLPEYPKLLICDCECEFEYEDSDLKEEVQRKFAPEEKLPMAICQSYSPRDCETFYKCPPCNRTFGDWSYSEKKARMSVVQGQNKDKVREYL